MNRRQKNRSYNTTCPQIFKQKKKKNCPQITFKYPRHVRKLLFLDRPYTSALSMTWNFLKEIDGLGGEIETLKPRLCDKLVCLDTKNMILLINTLVNLGLAYHFEKKIEKFMKDALEKVEDIIGGEGDMYTISIIFRVFRRYGHIVSSGDFS